MNTKVVFGSILYGMLCFWVIYIPLFSPLL